MNHLSTEILRRRVLSGLCFAAVVLGSGFAAWAQEKALPPGDFISARKMSIGFRSGPLIGIQKGPLRFAL
jgi:hypothetical protein